LRIFIYTLSLAFALYRNKRNTQTSYSAFQLTIGAVFSFVLSLLRFDKLYNLCNNKTIITYGSWTSK